MSKVNCAIYIRKSSEKGLEQEFNSLHNQEEACRNYILSQSFNNWSYYKTYEDGGISGGTMKRSGLKEMISDIKDGKIQTVVVYKVDRLSRSIIDFHNMMKEFNNYDCNFVSITQAFDTSNSMGQLTLNMLLSFAQFERELSSERVRHKVASSKAKGLWTGGMCPLGYNIKNKKLIINKKEAKDILTIFEKYVEFESVLKLREYLKENSIRSKSWTSPDGVKKGGSVLAVSMVARLLRSQLYIGKIEHKNTNQVYEGIHEAIISQELFDKAQTLLSRHNKNIGRVNSKTSFLLNNKIVDSKGQVFKNQKSGKNEVKKYRFYIIKGLYLPAHDLERIVINIVKDILNSDLKKLLPKSKVLELKYIDFDKLAHNERYVMIKKFVNKVIYRKNRMTCHINVGDLAFLKDFKNAHHENTENKKVSDDIFISEDKNTLVVERDIFINNRISSNTYRSYGKHVVTKSENSISLIKALSYGWSYKKMYEQGMSITTIRENEKKAGRTIYKYLNLTYLSPNIINNIMDSNVPSHISLQSLFEISSKHINFKDQETAFYQQ